MKRTILRCAAGLLIAAALLPTALAAEPFPAVTEVQVCYPTSITRSEDGTEIRKVYDLSPEQDPAGIPRSDFEQDGFHYTLTDLLQQELPDVYKRQGISATQAMARLTMDQPEFAEKPGGPRCILDGLGSELTKADVYKRQILPSAASRPR